MKAPQNLRVKVIVINRYKFSTFVIRISIVILLVQLGLVSSLIKYLQAEKHLRKKSRRAYASGTEGKPSQISRILPAKHLRSGRGTCKSILVVC